MRWLVLMLAAIIVCSGCCYATDDEIARQLEQEALQAISNHDAKLKEFEREEAAKRQIEVKAQPAQTRRETKQKQMLEKLRQASDQLAQERKGAELEELTRIRQAEDEKQARVRQILNNMRQTLREHDRAVATWARNEQANYWRAKTRIQDAQKRFVNDAAARQRERNRLRGAIEEWTRMKNR